MDMCPQPYYQARMIESIRQLVATRNKTYKVNNQSSGNAALPGELISKISKLEILESANMKV